MVAAGRRRGIGAILKGIPFPNNTLFGYELEDDCPLSAIAHKVYIGKKFSPIKYRENIEDLNNVCKEASIDLIIPFSCQASAWLYSYADKLIAPALTCSGARICYDKECFAQWFKGGDLSRHYPWPVEGEFATFKPSSGCGGDGIYYEKFRGECPIDHVAQHHLKEPEFSADCYYDKLGNFVAGAVREREVVAAGEVLESIVIDRPDILEIVKKVGKVISFKGPICAQFMSDYNGVPKITEINARFGGGAPLSIYAGLPFHEWVIEEYIEGKALQKSAYSLQARVGAKTRRSYQDCFFN